MHIYMHVHTDACTLAHMHAHTCIHSKMNANMYMYILDCSFVLNYHTSEYISNCTYQYSPDNHCVYIDKDLVERQSIQK